MIVFNKNIYLSWVMRFSVALFVCVLFFMPSLGVAGKSLDKIIYSLIESIIHDSHLEGTGILVSQNLFFERQTGISPLFSSRKTVTSNLAAVSGCEPVSCLR